MRERTGRFAVEGPQGVREAVRWAAPRVRDVYLTPEALERYADDIAEPARAAGLRVHEVTPEVLAAMAETDAPQGALAVSTPPPASSAPCWMPGHASSCCSPTCATPATPAPSSGAPTPRGPTPCSSAGPRSTPTPKVVRSTGGSLFHLPVVTGLDVGDDPRGWAGTASAPTGRRRVGTTLLPDADLTARTAGSWATRPGACDAAVRDACDGVVRELIHGRAESLNLAMAATVCLYASAGQPIRGLGPPVLACAPCRSRFNVPDEPGLQRSSSFIPDGLVVAVGADAARALRERRAPSGSLGVRGAPTSLGRDIRRGACRCTDLDGRDWWDVHRPVGRACATRTGHRERLLVLPPGPRACSSPRSYVRGATRAAGASASCSGLRDAEARQRAEARAAPRCSPPSPTSCARR